MSLLIVPIVAAEFDTAARAIHLALAGGADGVELRIDCMSEVSDDQVVRLCADVPADKTILLTIRSRAEGGEFDGDEMTRVSRLIELGPQVQWIDYEAAAWFASANIRQKVMLAVRRARHAETGGPIETIDHDGRRGLVLSRHYVQGRPAKLTAELVKMIAEPAADIVKLAWTARTVRDNFEAFELLRETPHKLIVTVMGDAGLPSRILARKFGAAATFAALDIQSRAAPGQATLHEMKELYRWDAIGPRTAVFGLIGDPVAHSLSPAVHNAAFAASGIDAVYVPFQVAAGYESFKAFMVELLARPWMDWRGLSVTAPHKENALRFVRETGGKLDETLVRIGAVNTLTMDQGGALQAANTDIEAVRAALIEACRGDESALAGRRVAIRGAGGAARACAAAVSDSGSQLTIYARSLERAQSMAQAFDADARDWSTREQHDADIIINATPLGQSPRDDETPVPAAALRPGMVVLDVVYRPRETRLLREARAAGCVVSDGLNLFLRQAARQSEIWCGGTAPTSAMRDAALRELVVNDR